MTKRSASNLARTFGWPLALGVLTVAALVGGLLGEHAWDVVAVVALGVPTGLGVWKLVEGLRR